MIIFILYTNIQKEHFICHDFQYYQISVEFINSEYFIKIVCEKYFLFRHNRLRRDEKVFAIIAIYSKKPSSINAEKNLHWKIVSSEFHVSNCKFFFHLAFIFYYPFYWKIMHVHSRITYIRTCAIF